MAEPTNADLEKMLSDWELMIAENPQEHSKNYVRELTIILAIAREGLASRKAGEWRPRKSHTAARVYQHFVVSEEAAKADLLPGARRTK